MTSPAQAKKSPPKHIVHLFRMGTLVGFTFKLQTPLPTDLVLNAACRLQWLRLRLPHADLLLYPQGTFRLEEVRPYPGMSLTYNQQGRLSSINGQSIRYDHVGRIVALGQITMRYDPKGRLDQIGQIVLKRRDALNLPQLQSIGKWKLSYQHDGRLKALAGLEFQYRSDGRIAAFGAMSFSYDSTQNSLRASQGVNKRFTVHVAWSQIDVQRILRTKR